MSLRLSGGRRLRSPAGQLARPTPARVRLAVMNLLAREVPGCRWLDLCCGSGAMAAEALQRGARQVVAVERHREMAALARRNLEAVADAGAAEATVACAEVVRWLAGGTAIPFDLIYADPPYGAGLHLPIAAAVAKGRWLDAAGTLVWECGSTAVPETPQGWELRDRRRYGGTTLVLLRPAAAAGGQGPSAGGEGGA